MSKKNQIKKFGFEIVDQISSSSEWDDFYSGQEIWRKKDALKNFLSTNSPHNQSADEEEIDSNPVQLCVDISQVDEFWRILALHLSINIHELAEHVSRSIQTKLKQKPYVEFFVDDNKSIWFAFDFSLSNRKSFDRLFEFDQDQGFASIRIDMISGLNKLDFLISDFVLVGKIPEGFLSALYISIMSFFGGDKFFTRKDLFSLSLDIPLLHKQIAPRIGIESKNDNHTKEWEFGEKPSAEGLFFMWGLFSNNYKLKSSRQISLPSEHIESKQMTSYYPDLDEYILSENYKKAAEIIDAGLKKSPANIFLQRRKIFIAILDHTYGQDSLKKVKDLLSREEKRSLVLSYSFVVEADKRLEIVSNLCQAIIDRVGDLQVLPVLAKHLTELLGDFWYAVDKQAARECYLQVLSMDPSRVVILYKLLVLAEHFHDNDMQLEYIESLLKIERRKFEKAKLYLKLAELKPESAEDLQVLSLQMYCDSIETLKNVIDKMLENAHAQEAVSLLDEILEQQQENPVIVEHRAHMEYLAARIWFSYLNRADLAKVRIDSSLEVNADFLEAWHLKVEILEQEKNKVELLSFLMKFEELSIKKYETELLNIRKKIYWVSDDARQKVGCLLEIAREKLLDISFWQDSANFIENGAAKRILSLQKDFLISKDKELNLLSPEYLNAVANFILNCAADLDVACDFILAQIDISIFAQEQLGKVISHVFASLKTEKLLSIFKTLERDSVSLEIYAGHIQKFLKRDHAKLSLEDHEWLLKKVLKNVTESSVPEFKEDFCEFVKKTAKKQYSWGNWSPLWLEIAAEYILKISPKSQIDTALEIIDLLQYANKNVVELMQKSLVHIPNNSEHIKKFVVALIEQKQIPHLDDAGIVQTLKADEDYLAQYYFLQYQTSRNFEEDRLYWAKTTFEKLGQSAQVYDVFQVLLLKIKVSQEDLKLFVSIAQKLRRVEDSIRLLTAQAEISSEPGKVWYYIARLLRNSELLEAAKKSILKAQTFEPQNILLQELSAEIAELKRDTHEEKKHWHKVLSLASEKDIRIVLRALARLRGFNDARLDDKEKDILIQYLTRIASLQRSEIPDILAKGLAEIVVRFKWQDLEWSGAILNFMQARIFTPAENLKCLENLFLNLSVANTYSDLIQQIEGILLGNHFAFKNLFAAILDKQYLAQLSQNHSAELLNAIGKYGFEKSELRTFSLKAYETLFELSPKDERSWVPIYLLLFQMDDSLKLFHHLNIIVPLIAKAPAILRAYPINLESLERQKNQLEEKFGEIKSPQAELAPVITIVEKTNEGDAQLFVELKQVAGDFEGLQNSQTQNIDIEQQRIENKMKNDLELRVLSALNVDENNSVIVRLVNEDREKTTSPQWNGSIYQAGEKTNSKVQHTGSKKHSESTAQGMHWDDVIDWRVAINELKANPDIAGRLVHQAFASELEKHVAIQIAAVMTGSVSEIEDWHWRVWRYNNEYGYPLKVGDRFPAEETHSVLSGRLARLIVELTPLFVSLFTEKFNMMGLALEMRLPINLISRMRKPLDFSHPLLKQSALFHYQNYFKRKRIQFFGIEGLQAKVYYDQQNKHMYFDPAFMKNMPQSHLTHRVLYYIWASKLNFLSALILDPKDVLMVISELKENFQASGLQKIRQKLGFSNSKTWEELLRFQKAGRLLNIDMRVMQVMPLHQARLMELWDSMRLHVFKCLITETLDIIGIVESLSGRDLLKVPFTSEEEFFKVHPYHQSLFQFVLALGKRLEKYLGTYY